MHFLNKQELLALEERMGTVSTAVPEEVLTKCLKRSIYHCIADCIENGDEVKCSICQVFTDDLVFDTFPSLLIC